MRNPLIKRIPKELVSEWHKYLVIIVFMVIMISVISGMYIGHDSMLSSVYSNRDALNLEDGRFELSGRASREIDIDDGSGLRSASNQLLKYDRKKGVRRIVAAAGFLRESDSGQPLEGGLEGSAGCCRILNV